MDERVICPQCGGEVPARARRGLCPACVATALGEAMFGGGEEDVGGDVGGEVPGYVFERVLGEGAAGVVWAARERGAGGREVAVKVLKAGLVAGDARLRFEAEMAVLRMLEHPGIARVYGSGETADGRPFFALERIDGAGICEHCEAGKLGVRERLELFRELCLAVGYAHRRGVIHRDLKPSNALVAKGENGGVKVIDFGIAKATERLLTEATLLTRAGEFLGTPAYMSPEQVELKGDGVDTRTDVYALGVILYELLTGALPFGGEVSYEELLRRVREDDPVRPSVRGGERGVDVDLDWIVLKAMEKEAGRRYETAEALARDVGRFLDGDGVEARPPTLGYRVRKYVRRHRVGVGAAGVVLLAMVVATVVSVAMYVRAEGHAARAEASDRRGREVFSRADFTQATPLLDDGRPALAVAHLARALRTDPGNGAAAKRLMFTLASENWARREAGLAANGRVAYTPDRSRILVAKHAVPEVEGTHQRFPFVKVFDAASGELEATLRLGADHGDFVVSPSGEWLVVGTALGVVEVWDLASGERVRELEGRGDTGCAQVCFSDDGAVVACSYWHRGWARVWRVEGWELVAEVRMEDAEGLPGWVDFSEEGRFLGFGMGDGVRVFEAEGGKAVSEVLEHGGEVTGVAVVRYGRVASWSRDAKARVWDWREGEAVLVLEHEQAVAVGALSPDGSRLLTGTGGGFGVGGVVRMWDVETGEVIGEPVRHAGEVRDVVFSADGMRAASGSVIGRLGDGAVQVIDGWTGEAMVAPIYHPQGAGDLAFSPDGERLAVSSGHLESAVWSLRPTALRPLRLAHPGPVWRVIFGEWEGRETVVTLTFGGEARRWDVVTGELVEGPGVVGELAVAAYAASGEDSLRGGFQARRWVGSYAHTHPLVDSKFRRTLGVGFSVGEVFAAAASEDGEVLVTGCGDGRVRVWSVRSGELVGELEHGGGRVTAVALDLAGGRVVGGGSDGMVKVWSVADGVLLGEMAAFGGEVSVAGFSGDGETVAVGGAGGGVRVWRYGGGGDFELEYGGRVNHVAFGLGDGMLAASGVANVVKVWEMVGGKEVGGVMAHSGEATYGLFLLWCGDGGRLVTAGSGDNTARVWDVAGGGMAVPAMGQPTSAYSVALGAEGGELLYGARSSRVWDTRSGEPLTPLLEQDEVALSAAIDGTGGRFATATSGGGVYVWPFPSADAAAGAEFLRFAEAVAGFRFNEVGVLEMVGSGELEEAGVALAGVEDGWVRWLVADGERAVGPGCGVGEGEWVEGLVADGGVGALREAMVRRPGDAGVVSGFARAVVEAGGGSARAGSVGRFLARRAAGEAAGLGWEAAGVVLGSGRGGEAVLMGAGLWLAGGGDGEFAGLLEGAGWRESAAVVREGGEGVGLLREVFGGLCGGDEGGAMRRILEVLGEKGDDGFLGEVLGRAGVLMGRVGHGKGGEAIGYLREGIGLVTAAGGDPVRLWGAVWRVLKGMGRGGEAREIYLGVRGIPTRGEVAGIGVGQLDLSPHYNRGLGEGDYGTRADTNDLRSLGAGRHEFGGTVFDVRGVVQLASGSVERTYPGGYATEVEIGVGTVCGRLRFLHGASYAAVDGAAIASYLVRYEGGDVVEVPLRVGEEIADWWMDAGEGLPGAEVVWRGVNPEAEAEGKVLGLQVFTWENPEPGRVVESVVFRSELDELARPFLVAVTVEE